MARRCTHSWLLALALAACSRSSTRAPDPEVATAPARAATAGDRLMARVPAGAQLVLEVDLARLRANPAVGALVTGLVDGDAALPGPLPPLTGADAMVLAAYRLGTAEATAITVVEGGTAPRDAIALDDRVWAIADEGQTARLLAVGAGAPSLAGDGALRVVRDQAMPAAADGASVRVAARLDETARRGLGVSLDLVDPPPATISLWADVADDLAVIVRLGDDPGQAATLRAVQARLAALPELGLLGVRPAVTAATIARDPAGARGVLVIGPGRLARAVARWQAHREAPP